MTELRFEASVASQDHSTQLGAAGMELERRQARVDAHICTRARVSTLQTVFSAESNSRSGVIESFSSANAGRPGARSHELRMSAWVVGRTIRPLKVLGAVGERGSRSRLKERGEGGRERVASSIWRGRGLTPRMGKGMGVRTWMSVGDSS